MRFHVTKNSDGKPVDFFVRVFNEVPKAKYDGPEGCQCSVVYPVNMQSVGMDHVRQGAYIDGKKFVCGCHGKIVP